MEYMQGIYIFIVLILAVVLVWPRGRKKTKQAAQELVGMCAATLERSSKKEERKQKALVFLREKGEAGNVEIREALGVSRQSVVRYMNELEAEGKVVQVGNAGHSVIYKPL